MNRDYYLQNRERLIEQAKLRYYSNKRPAKVIEDLEGEVWRVVYNNYAVSNFGRVKSLGNFEHLKKDEMLLKESIHNGYPTVKVNRRPFKVGILVAKAFPEICGEWFEGCEVHHIDHKRENNVPENLKVMSHEEHQKYHSESEVTYNKRSAAQRKAWESRSRDNNKSRQPVIAVKNGSIFKVYDSGKEAAADLGICESGISNNLKGRCKYCCGYQFIRPCDINKYVKIEKR